MRKNKKELILMAMLFIVGIFATTIAISLYIEAKDLDNEIKIANTNCYEDSSTFQLDEDKNILVEGQVDKPFDMEILNTTIKEEGNYNIYLEGYLENATAILVINGREIKLQVETICKNSKSYMPLCLYYKKGIKVELRIHFNEYYYSDYQFKAIIEKGNT